MKIVLTYLIIACLSIEALSQTISGGGAHAVTICPDSTLSSWGQNASGQLGDSSTTNKVSPVKVWYIQQAVQLGGGVDHSIVLKADGTVWTWGLNIDGQLGDSTNSKSIVPKQVHGPGNVGYLSGIRAIATGHLHHHNLAIKQDSTLWAWGFNLHGQLGDSTLTNRWVPVKVHGINGVTSVATGDVHSIAITKDSSVWTWGLNNKGMLGDSSITKKIVPVKVYGLKKVTAVSGGELHTLALRADSTVWGWGANYNGQLGDSSTTDRIIPVMIPVPGKVTALAAGGEHSLALLADSSVWAWGVNWAGQVGDSTLINKLFPVKVKKLSSVVEISAGGGISYARKKDGSVWSWGMGTFGQLGNGSTGYAPCNCSLVPVQVWGPCGLATEIPENKNENEILIYPNPSNGRFNVKGLSTTTTLKIFDLLGSEVFTQTQYSTQEFLNLDLPNGIYFLQLNSENAMTTMKLIIQH